MTEDQRKAFCDDLDALYDKNREALEHGDYVVDSILYGIADLLELEASEQSHDGVRACLEGSAERIRHAALDYYCSMK